MGHRALTVAAAPVMLAAVLAASVTITAQSAPAFDTLSDTQQRLLAGLAAQSSPSGNRSMDARATFEGADPSFRTAFATITTALAAVSLSDHENGEILGVALDLVSGLEALEDQPAGRTAGFAQLSVTLAPGARDRLRRSSEFALDGGRETVNYPSVYLQKNSPSLQFGLDATGSRALISIPR